MIGSIDEHLDALAADLGRSLVMGPDRTLELRFEGGIAVTLELTAENGLYFYSVMGAAPSDLSALRALLESQFFGQIAGGARFAIDPANGDLLLIERIDLANMPPQAMPRTLSAFLTEVRRWLAAQPWRAADMRLEVSGSGPRDNTIERPGAADAASPHFPPIRV